MRQILQLGRMGDIVSILPLAQKWLAEGEDVEWIVSRHYADILDLDPRIRRVEVDEDQVHLPTVMQRSPEALVPQVNQNPVQWQTRRENFQLEQWDRAGVLDQFHTLPLTLTPPEAAMDEARKFLCGRADYVLINLASHSSPLPNEEIVAEAIKEHLTCPYVDITNVRFVHPGALVEILRQARSLITVDSLPLHLSYGTDTPVYALSRDALWYQSEQRLHWMGRCGYFEALEQAADIAKSAMRAKPLMEYTYPKRYVPNIIHVYNRHITANPDHRCRYQAAERNWQKITQHGMDLHWQTVTHDTNPERTAKAIGDKRALPLVTDVLQFGVDHCESDDDIVVFTNQDNLLCREAAMIIRQTLRRHPCCWSSRCDVNPPAPPMLSATEVEVNHSGTDLFAFQRGWWLEHGDQFPTMYIGAEGWDWILRDMMGRFGGVATRCLVYHATHDMEWIRPDNLNVAPSQLWCRHKVREYCFHRDIDWSTVLSNPGKP